MRHKKVIDLIRKQLLFFSQTSDYVFIILNQLLFLFVPELIPAIKCCWFFSKTCHIFGLSLSLERPDKDSPWRKERILQCRRWTDKTEKETDRQKNRQTDRKRNKNGNWKFVPSLQWRKVRSLRRIPLDQKDDQIYLDHLIKSISDQVTN